MIKPSDFYNLLVENQLHFFCGVPDSLLKDFCAYILKNTDSARHIITANEGNAIALATGYYLSTNKIPVVYMQNSGLGNCVNPLVSLTDSEVYSIPILLIIGWRGEPGIRDEPQHVKQGKITLELLNNLGIEFCVLSRESQKSKLEVLDAIKYLKEKSAPYSIVVRKGTFETYRFDYLDRNPFSLKREEAIELIVTHLRKEDIVVSTTGKASRELFELREKWNQPHCSDFLTVGSMGHSSNIALGISLEKPDRNIYCIDGDGSLIMHMGALAMIGMNAKRNFKHIILNNGAHESVGGQPTVGLEIDICSIAKACGYETVYSASNEVELLDKLPAIQNSEGASFLEIRINTKSRKDLGRPKSTPLENKNEFIRFIR